MNDQNKNRMQDLNFEENVSFESVKDIDFTRRAAQKFRQVVSLDTFEDEDAEVIFHYLYKEMELVSFGDYLKRYIYERAGLTDKFSDVPQEVYREIVMDSFKETFTPKKENPMGIIAGIGVLTVMVIILIVNWFDRRSRKRREDAIDNYTY